MAQGREARLEEEQRVRLRPDRHQYFTLRAVIDDAEYAKLAGVAATAIDPANGFFPAYRAPRK